MTRRLALFLLLAALPGFGQVTIKHVVFLVKENRSFDQYFGTFPGVVGGPITTALCFGSEGGCPAPQGQRGSMNLLAGNPNAPDADCGHLHGDIVRDYDAGDMDKFNQSCSGSNNWANQYNGSTIPNYWQYASNYGLADHMRASAMAPTMPSHLIFFAGTSNEARDNPNALITGKNGNGVNGQSWSLDTFHYGRCNGGTNGNGLCTTNSDCPGASCVIDSYTGKCCTQGQACDFTANGNTCIKNTDCASTQFCSNGNTYGEIGGGGNGQSIYYSIDLTGSSGAPGGNTGYGMFPGTCAAHRTTACVRVCPAGPPLPNECAIANSSDDTACTSMGDTCDAGTTQTPAILAGARGSVGPNVTTIGDLLSTAGISWGMYIPSSEELRNPAAFIQHHRYGTDWTTKIHPDTQFATDAGNCTSDSNCNLPGVSWVETTKGNEHPPNLVSVGEAWSVTQVTAVMNNPYLWNNTLLFIFWDDYGGFYDHLAPTVDNVDWRNGFRVPLICVGKYCKTEVVHTEFVFESTLKCIENVFGTGRLPGNLFDSTANDLCTGCHAGPGCTGHRNTGMIDLTLNDPPR
jgi:hypothetical protein